MWTLALGSMSTPAHGYKATPSRRQFAIDTATPMGKLVFQLTGAFAEFEQTMIRQRIKAGLKRAVAQGVKLGRPKIDSATERRCETSLRKAWVF
jgi:DNA invertase Pin-like site-specific DNA recombinase